MLTLNEHQTVQSLLSSSVFFDQPKYVAFSSWTEHVPFAFWMTSQLRPKVFVELGTHYGMSYFSVCQKVQSQNLECHCYAVDTWEGDEHSGSYSEDVYRQVKTHNDKNYSDFSTLLRMRFNQALDQFEDGSIDLLHIDGRHYYEDVKEDFESWIPKLSDRAVVMFHDTEVRERDFGVWKLWEKISQEYPSFNFLHGHGLGVIAYGPNVDPTLSEFFAAPQSESGTEIVRRVFATCGDRLSSKWALVEKSEMLSELEARHAELKNQLASLNASLVHGQQLLNTARRKPLRMLRHYITFKILKRLSNLTPPLPFRMTARFKRSAEKRDPRKSIVESSLSRKTDYQQWIHEFETPRTLTKEQQIGLAKDLADGPTFSVVMPVYNPNPELLKACIQSVLGQSYNNLEFCIADDASTDPEIARILNEFAASDTRIKLAMREVNGHICEASNSALELATGDYVALLDHDDLFPPYALLYMAKAISENPNAKVLYSDEDKMDVDGRREQPHFKPDFNRDLLYSYNYISHLGVYCRELINLVGGFRKGFEGAQDYDLLLRCISCISEDEIVHIPRILYHCLPTENSTASSASAKNYAHDAGKKALDAHLQNVGHTGANVTDGASPFTYKVTWPVPAAAPKVSLLIPTRDRLDLVQRAVESILSLTRYPNYEIVIIDNGSSEPVTLAWFESVCAKESRVRVLKYSRIFNYSAINNYGVENCDGEYVCLVNNDVEVISPEWLDEMVSLAVRPGVGCIGTMLYYPNDTVQHSGVVIGVGGVAGHLHKNFERFSSGYFGRLFHRQDLTAVTAACLLVSREIFDEVGGLNEEDLKVAFNDIDFCLKVVAAGYRNIWTPFAELYHHESASRGMDDVSPEKIKRFRSEAAYMEKTWRTDIFQDPHYNPNLTLDALDFSLRTKFRQE